MTTISETSVATFASQRPAARELYARAQQLLAGGVGHDLRHNAIAPTYVDHALGSRKWDVTATNISTTAWAMGPCWSGMRIPAVLAAVRGGDRPRSCTSAMIIRR